MQIWTQARNARRPGADMRRPAPTRKIEHVMDDKVIEKEPNGDEPSGKELSGEELNGEKPLRKKVVGALVNFNTLVAIMLAVCALTTAWATWIGDLHGSDQDSNYAKAERLNTEANASYNLNAQLYVAAFSLWSHVYEVNAEVKSLESAGDSEGARAKREYMNSYIETNCPDYENFKGAVYAALERGGTATPFEEYPQASFFTDSEKLAQEAAQAREDGNRCNLANDSYGLVSVLYSLCLFLFGMVGFYRQRIPRRIVFAVGVAVFVAATAYMLSLPLPDGFDFANYFKLSQ